MRHLASGHETLFSGHEKPVKSVAFSASGEYIASAGQDSFLLITDAQTQAVLRKLPVGDKGTAAIAFSPDGNRLATSGEDRIVRIWDTSTWDKIQEFSASPVDFSHCLAFSPDGSLLAYGTPRDEAVVRELATGKEVVLQGHRDAVRSVAFSPDSRFIATGSRDGSVKLWDARSFVVRCVLFKGIRHSFNRLLSRLMVRSWHRRAGITPCDYGMLVSSWPRRILAP